MSAIHADVLRPLQALDHIPKGAARYYVELTKSDDVCVAVGAWRALLLSGHITRLPDMWEGLVGMSQYRAIQRRAFEFFESEVFEHDLARRASDMPSSSLVAALERRNAARLTFDADGEIEALTSAFLASGDVTYLVDATRSAEASGGPEALPQWLMRLVLSDPNRSEVHGFVLDYLNNSGNAELLAEYSEILSSRGLYPEIALLFAATAAFHARDPSKALELIKRLQSTERATSKPFSLFLPVVYQIKARSEEKLGRFVEAYKDFTAMNASEVPSAFDQEAFFRGQSGRRQLRVPALPTEVRSDVVQMLGFPRSGTTLLENALAAHSQIETFEEIEALAATFDFLDRANNGDARPPTTAGELFVGARAKFYDEIDIRRRKPDAHVLIEKLPLQSSEAEFMSKLFPDWRYIFSIRHPCDVILSCFKERFAPTPAMDNFRRIERAVRVYDHTMSNWFAVHALDDPAVHYVRYDDLVTNFETVVTGVLNFLGLDWEDTVRDFAQAAQSRASRTPSYLKVRQGVEIGVQTYWRNYKFVFEAPEAQPLRKWATFFGYPTE